LNRRLRLFLISLFLLVFVGSGSVVLWHLQSQHEAAQIYENAANLAWNPSEETSGPAGSSKDALTQLPEPGLPLAETPVPTPIPTPTPSPLPAEAELLLDIDFAALREVNADVIGWIHIPDTSVSYPLLRSRDNKEYLNLTWDLQASSSGSIFLERKNTTELTDFNTLIYGHNMKNGKMFSPLHQYKNQSFADEHPYVYIATGERIFAYEVFSAYTADIVSDTYRLYFEDVSRKQAAIEFYTKKSEIEVPVTPSADDRILTLSTCTGLGNYNYRWVVQAVLVGEFPVA